MNEARQQAEVDAIYFLVGNQCDRELEREVSKEDALEFKKQHELDYWVECSAK